MDERAIVCIVFGAKIREVAESAVRSAVELVSMHSILLSGPAILPHGEAPLHALLRLFTSKLITMAYKP